VLSAANLITLTATAEDGDGDTASDSRDIGDSFKFKDDGPSQGGGTTGVLEEDDLNTSLSAGNDVDTTDGQGDSTGNRETRTINVGTQVVSGKDSPASINLKSTDPNTVLPQLFSKGDALTYFLTLDDTGEGGADVIRAFVDKDGGNERLIWTFLLTDDGSGGSLATLTLNDQLDHVDADGLFGDDIEDDILKTDGAPVEFIDFTDLLDIRDADGDVLELEAAFVRYRVFDDIPLFTADISDGLVDFAITDFVTNSLNGSVGTDENKGNDENTDGIKTYTFDGTAASTIGVSAVDGLEAKMSADLTKIEYFVDANDNGSVDTGELFFDIVLNQTANSGAGSYTFTVYQDPPPASLEFDFSGLPSNQSLFGMIPGSLADPTGKALLIMPKDVDLKTDGTYSNTSKTINTSKGGGEVTIGIGDQMFDGFGKKDKDADGDGGAYFVFVTDPDQDILAGISDSLSNVYDDADNIGFGGTFDTLGAEFTVVQNSTSMVARVAAYDIAPVARVGDSSVDAGVGTEGRAFILDPLATDVQVDINEIKIFSAPAEDGTTTLLEHVVRAGSVAVLQDIDGGGVGPSDDDPTVSISFVFADPDGDTNFAWVADIAVTEHNSGYTFAYIAAAPHDAVLIGAFNDPAESTGNKFDIGGFAISEAQPTPDQRFDYTVNITDFDGDVDTSNEFSIGVDGTGDFDDDCVDGVFTGCA